MAAGMCRRGTTCRWSSKLDRETELYIDGAGDGPSWRHGLPCPLGFDRPLPLLGLGYSQGAGAASSMARAAF